MIQNLAEAGVLAACAALTLASVAVMKTRYCQLRRRDDAAFRARDHLIALAAEADRLDPGGR